MGERLMYVSEFANCPARMLLELADIAWTNGNRKLHRIWIENYKRLISEV